MPNTQYHTHGKHTKSFGDVSCPFQSTAIFYLAFWAMRGFRLIKSLAGSERRHEEDPGKGNRKNLSYKGFSVKNTSTEVNFLVQ